MTMKTAIQASSPVLLATALTAAATVLAGPVAAPAETPPGAPPQTAAASPDFVRFKRISVADRPEMIGGEALSFLAPPDWRMEGGIVWRAHPTIPAAAAMRVRNPEGVEQLECFPTLAFSWGGYLAATGFPQGSVYLGNEVQPPVRDALAYLKERHLPRTRGSLHPKIVTTEELPALADAARAVEPASPAGGSAMRFTAGRIRIEYELAGKTVEEDLYCVLNSVSIPTANMTIRNAWVNSRGEYIVTESVNFDPNVELDGQWQKLERQQP